MSLRTERIRKLLPSSAKAAVTYVVTVFAIGFLLKTARILLLAPHVGSAIAVLLEVLTANRYVSGIWSKRLSVSAGVPARILVGAVAFVTQ